MPNRLISEPSPYLLQHAHNPVDWYPWGDAAFDTARRENKPVFLSVGYATCHWCHVMERESFENDAAAAALNQSFVCIKVDREERPDIDAVYMAACQMVTGSGGWPLTIIMTPDKQPFFAGTYIPRISAPGRLGLVDLCETIGRLWKTEPRRVLESAQTLSGHLAGAFEFEADTGQGPEMQVVDQTVQAITGRFDRQYSGFDSAPKFPMAHRLSFLLNAYERHGDEQVLDMTARTLGAMRLGGLWDHVGFGFHRYSTDRRWMLPHFEKMLYDQALLAEAYLKAFNLTKNWLFEQTARDIFTYVLRDMKDADGGFYTAEDADSEGEEGKFYLWSQSEFEALLPDDMKAIPWAEIFNMQRDGNFFEEATRKKNGTNILHRTQSWEDWARHLEIVPQTLKGHWETLRQVLFDVRVKRVPPLKDDKILTDWNGMMVAALAMGAKLLDDSSYLDAARKAAAFILDRMVDDSGRLLHRYRLGKAAIAATANDYSFFIKGLLHLFRADGDPQWLDRATVLQQTMNRDFWDSDKGGFFLTAVGNRELPVRPKEIYDGAIPSANAVALNNLMRLFQMTEEDEWREQARSLILAFGGSVRRQPSAFIHMLEGWVRVMGDSGKQDS